MSGMNDENILLARVRAQRYDVKWLRALPGRLHALGLNVKHQSKVGEREEQDMISTESYVIGYSNPSLSPLPSCFCEDGAGTNTT